MSQNTDPMGRTRIKIVQSRTWLPRPFVLCTTGILTGLFNEQKCHLLRYPYLSDMLLCYVGSQVLC
jgi:hypothetical protein